MLEASWNHPFTLTHPHATPRSVVHTIVPHPTSAPHSMQKLSSKKPVPSAKKIEGRYSRSRQQWRQEGPLCSHLFGRRYPRVLWRPHLFTFWEQDYSVSLKRPPSLNKAARPAAALHVATTRWLLGPVIQDRARETADCRGGMGLGHFYCWERLGNSLQLHSGPHLSSRRVLDNQSLQNRCHSKRCSASLQKRKWRGSAYGPTWGPTWGLPGTTAGSRTYPRSLIFMCPWILSHSQPCAAYQNSGRLCLWIHVLQPQTKPLPPWVPSGESQGTALSISACQEGRHSVSLPRWGRPSH